mmetsp:Transcript_34565/g.86837  ORF Transcript_34565/g.86837 Transcript_34565/m.86837 type:complete len:204 (+) Transcript_34565:1110-1721(+)
MLSVSGRSRICANTMATLCAVIWFNSWYCRTRHMNKNRESATALFRGGSLRTASFNRSTRSFSGEPAASIKLLYSLKVSSGSGNSISQAFKSAATICEESSEYTMSSPLSSRFWCASNSATEADTRKRPCVFNDSSRLRCRMTFFTKVGMVFSPGRAINLFRDTPNSLVVVALLVIAFSVLLMMAADHCLWFFCLRRTWLFGR